MTNTKTVKTSKSFVGKSGTDWSKAPEGAIGIDGRYDVWVKNKYAWWNFEDQGWCVGRNNGWGSSRYIMKEDDLREVYDTTRDVNDNPQEDNKGSTSDKFYTEMTITYANGKKYTVKGLRVDEDVVSVDFGKMKSNKETDVCKGWSTEDWILNTGDFKPGTTWGQKYDWLCSKGEYGIVFNRYPPRGKLGYEQMIELLSSRDLPDYGRSEIRVLQEKERAKREAHTANTAEKKHEANNKKPIPELTSVKPNISGLLIAHKLKLGYPLTQEEMQWALKVIMEDKNYI